MLQIKTALSEWFLSYFRIGVVAFILYFDGKDCGFERRTVNNLVFELSKAENKKTKK